MIRYYLLILALAAAPSAAKALTCVVSTGPVNFGAVLQTETRHIDITGNISVSCSGSTAGTTIGACVDIAAEAVNGFNHRQIANGGAELGMQLFQDFGTPSSLGKRLDGPAAYIHVHSHGHGQLHDAGGGDDGLRPPLSFRQPGCGGILRELPRHGGLWRGDRRHRELQYPSIGSPYGQCGRSVRLATRMGISGIAMARARIALAIKWSLWLNIRMRSVAES